VMTAQAIREKSARITGFPPLLEAHLTHLVLAHHGQLEFGSPKVPMTLEAYVVHAIDLLDSRIDSWLDLMARDPGETWTEQTKLYDRPLPTPPRSGAAAERGGARARWRAGEGARRAEGGGGSGDRPPRAPRPRRPPRRSSPSSPWMH